MPNRIEDGVYKTHMRSRHARGVRMQLFYLTSLIVSFIVLIVLLASIVNQTYGLVVVDVKVQPRTLEAQFNDTPLDDLSSEQLGILIYTQASAFLNADAHQYLSSLPTPRDTGFAAVAAAYSRADPLPERLTFLDPSVMDTYVVLDDEGNPLSGEEREAALADRNLTAESLGLQGLDLTDFVRREGADEDLPAVFDPAVNTIRDLRDYSSTRSSALQSAYQTQALVDNLSTSQLLNIVEERIVQSSVLEAWNLNLSILRRDGIEEVLLEYQEEEERPGAFLEWRSWISLDFITGSLNPNVPAEAGIAPALIGTIWIMVLVVLFSFPLGVGAALYLEEYARDTWYNRIIETNIRNLAGVPSIIYGLLGLAVFVRALEELTTGSVFGITGRDRGDTVLSAALTLTLLILPVIIIQTQEALKAVPSSIREGSYGLGATKWQTISRQIFPSALPGIMTGTIIALSRAIGETAPILVVGGSTFVGTNPDGPFSGFTALPLIIYNWTSQPNPQFQNAASAAIIVLLVLLLTMNSIGVYIRNRASKRSIA